MDANMTKFISWCCIIKVLISTITMDAITKPYHIAVCTYRATPPPTSQWGNRVQNQQKTFFFDWLCYTFIHQAYNNKDLSATTVMITKSLALFFSTTSVVLFSEQTVFSLITNQYKHRHKPNFSDDHRFIPALSDGHLMKCRSRTKA
jgi:hypothetical protein